MKRARSIVRRVTGRLSASRSDLVAARLLVLERDGYACVRCGQTLAALQARGGWLEVHHRVARGMGGASRDPAAHSPDRLVSLCFGWGDGGCHRWVEQHRQAAEDAGLLVRKGGDPRQLPVCGADGWWLLAWNGTRSRVVVPEDEPWIADVPW